MRFFTGASSPRAFVFTPCLRAFNEEIHPRVKLYRLLLHHAITLSAIGMGLHAIAPMLERRNRLLRFIPFAGHTVP
jgi:hypothetical protein